MSTDPRVIEELAKAADLFPTQVDAEAAQPYLNSLISKVSALPDAIWENFSIEAQDYTNASVRAITAGEKVEEIDLTALVQKKDQSKKDERIAVGKSRQTKRRNIWGRNTVAGETARYLIETNFANLNPSDVLVEIRKRGVKASIETTDSAISVTLRVLGSFFDTEFLDAELSRKLKVNIEEVNKLL